MILPQNDVATSSFDRTMSDRIVAGSLASQRLAGDGSPCRAAGGAPALPPARK